MDNSSSFPIRTALLLLALCFYAQCALSAMPEKIIIQGNINANEESVRSVISSVIQSESIDDRQIDRILKALYATQLFSDVKVSYTNGILTVRLIENELISDIIFEGNYSLGSSSLEKEVQLKPRTILSPTKLQEDVRRILGIYRNAGYYNASVEVALVKRPEKVNVLLFIITEGGKSLIDNIEFLGNHTFNQEVLQGALFSQTATLLNFMSRKSRYDADIPGHNEELLRTFYMNRGFPDFKIISTIAELNDDRTGITITFSLEEGKRYKIGTVRIDNALSDFDPAKVAKALVTKNGAFYNRSEINGDIETLTIAANELGYASVSITAEYERHEDQTLIDVAFKVKEAPKVYINKIELTGNTRTLDKVIRRKILLSDGDPFSMMKLKKSHKNLSGMGYFGQVGIETLPTDLPDKVDIKFETEDQKTGEVYLSISASTQEGLIGTVALDEKNFLGTGQLVNISLQKYSYGSSAQFGWYDPYFLDYNFLAGVHVFYNMNTKRQSVSYDSKLAGFAVNSSVPIMEHMSLGTRYAFHWNDIFNVDPGSSVYIKEQEGTYVLSLLEYSIHYNRMDPYSNTPKGVHASFKQGGTGGIGDSHFIKTQYDVRLMYPIFEKRILYPGTLTVGFSSGYLTSYGDNQVRLNDRFYLGGDDFRGFLFRGLGPRDKYTQDALGGHYVSKFLVQAEFPLIFKGDIVLNSLGMRGYTFIDAGTLFGIDNPSFNVLDSSQLRASFGAGVSVMLPFVGIPVRIDASFPVWRAYFDKVKYVNLRFSN